MKTIQDALKERILIIDGAMGTMIQRYKLSEEDYRGTRFADYPSDLKGNNDLLSITRPEIIKAIHLEYLEAGADIIETNTFNAQAISLADYNMSEIAYELNIAAVNCAKEAVKSFLEKHPERADQAGPFIAGAIGPMNKTLSLSPDVNNPGYRSVSFDEVANAYYEQVKGLVDGGVDLLLIETIFDTLNAKAAIYAIKKYFRDTRQNRIATDDQRYHYRCIRQDIKRTNTGSFLYFRTYMPIRLSIGLNCALGAEQMRAHIEELSQIAACFTSAYPNAGLPNTMGEYDETPDQTAHHLEDWAKEGFVNIVGGCCGTTPDHIRHIADHVKKLAPRPLPVLLSTTDLAS